MYKAKIYIRGRAKKHHASLTGSEQPHAQKLMQACIGADRGNPMPNLVLDSVSLDDRPDFRWTTHSGIKVIKGTKEHIL